MSPAAVWPTVAPHLYALEFLSPPPMPLTLQSHLYVWAKPTASASAASITIVGLIAGS